MPLFGASQRRNGGEIAGGLSNRPFRCLSPASRFPFETWIAPKEQKPAFGNVSDADLADLAQVLKSTLWGLYIALDNPDYNYVVHSGPVEKGQTGPYLWYIEIIPRLTKIAGFELGSGTAINTTLPEETAEFMRRAR